MKIFIWRHNRKYHSWSMINEPCVQQSLYTDAVAIVAAESPAAALELLAASGEGWRITDLRLLPHTERELETPSVLFTDVRNE